MSKPTNTALVVEELPAHARGAVAPLARVPFGLAVGTVLGLVLFLLTAAHTWVLPADSNDLFVWLLGNNFMPGMRPTPTGALAALGWGFGWGFAFGWGAALARNAFVLACVRWIAWRERLRQSGAVLDDLM